MLSSPSSSCSSVTHMNRLYSHLFLMILLSLLAIHPSASAQRSDLQSWTAVGVSVPMDTKKQWSLLGEVQPRIGKNVQQIERFLVLTSVSHTVSQGVDIALGHGWTPGYMNSNYDDDFRNENRTFQAVSIKSTLGDWSFRYRLLEEQRFIQGASGLSNRLRLLVGGSMRVLNQSDAGLSFWNDYFINLNSVRRGPQVGFDRDRFFFGPYLNQNRVRYEIGYLGEFGAHFGGDDRMINAFMVGVRFKG